MKKFILVISMLLSGLASTSVSAAGTIATPYSAFTSWLPIILLAAGLAISLTVLYYFIGVLLNNARVKGQALTELQNAVGTIFLVAIIIGVLGLFGAATGISFQNLLGSSGQASVNNICTTTLANSQIEFLNSKEYPYYTGHSLPSPTTAVCAIVTGGPGIGATTHNVDYGLAASYVIIANLTNESSQEVNALYNEDSLFFFLRNMQQYVGVCVPVTCALPIVQRDGSVTLSYLLYFGYILHRSIMPTLIAQANVSFYMFITQLLVILILLVSWPYMLAAGILLRSFTFTRRAGGLIIALTIVGTIIYPMLLLFQYASLSNISSQTYNQCIVSHGGPSTSADNACSAYTGAATFIGADKVPALSLCGANLRPDSSSPTNYDYQIYCYTSSSTLPTNTIYKDIPLPAGSPSTISACSGSPWTTSPPEPGTSSTKVPSCYVRKTLSFYTFPSAAGAIALYTCYIPYKGSAPDSLIGFEETVLLQNVVSSPLTLLQSFTQGQFFSSVTSNPLNQEVDGTGPPCNIGPIYIWASIASLINIYGLISVISFILPILNILLMLSATAGISHLIGGETSITGLTRFI